MVGTSEQLYLAEHPAGRLDDSDTMPDTAGGEVVTGPLNRKPYSDIF